MYKKIILFLFVLFPGLVFAENITKADLQAAASDVNHICDLEEASVYGDKCDPTDFPQFTVEDSYISITYKGKNYNADYQIENDGKVSFSLKSTFNNGVTKEEYEAQRDVEGYIFFVTSLVAKAKGGNYLDYYLYSMLSLIEVYEVPDDPNAEYTSYMIVSDGVSIDGGEKVLVVPESDYGDYIVEMATIDKRPVSGIKDHDDGTEDTDGFIDSYEYSRTFTITDSSHSYSIVTVVVDPEADFESLNGLMASFVADPTHDATDPEADKPQEENESQQPVKDKDVPKTGSIVSLVFICVLSVVGLVIVLFNQNRKVYHI